MKKWSKITITIMAVLVVGTSLMAFRSIGDPPDGDHAADHTAALANALGITVEELESAYQAVSSKMVEQAVEDGYMTQDQADKILSGELPTDGRRMRGPGQFMRGEEFNTLLAEELGIDLETLQTAQAAAQESLLAQALEDGEITQEEFDLRQAHYLVNPYVQEAFAQAYQNALDLALADGTITEDQAALLLSNADHMGRGIGMPGFGHKHGGHPPFPGPAESEGN